MAILRDIAVNYRFDDTGYPASSEDNDVLADSIYAILSTVPGERVHRPSFGCYLKMLIHGNISKGEAQRARVEARRAVELWEKRVIVDQVLFELGENKISLHVLWRPRGRLVEARRSTVEFEV
jgi:hypothetical protein